MRRPDTKQDLWLFIYQHFGLRLPWQSHTRGHSSPFEFVWSAYADPAAKLAAWANRSGLKTLCASVIAALEYRFAEVPIQSRVLAGSEDQAKNLYRYWENWCWKVLGDRLRADPGRLLTRLDNGSLEILAASPKRVRGAKVQRLYRDEEDEIDPEISAASVGMLASLDGIPARTIVTSTWHNPAGPMGRLIAASPGNGYKVHKWNIWESIERCPPERHDNGRNCEGCPLGRFCLAKARESHPGAKLGAAAHSGGLLSIIDVIGQAQEWSLQQWQAEVECRRPSLEGMVYPQFDRAVHVLPDLDFRDDLPTYRAIDWGLNNFVCLWIQVHGGAAYVVDEYWAENATVHDNGNAIKKLDAEHGLDATYCDPAGRSRSDQTGISNVQAFKALGIPCRYRLDKWATTVQNGIHLIRGALRPAVGEPRLFVAAACKRLIDAFEGYRLRKVNNEYIDEPIKPQEPHDHAMDALRYFFVNRMAPIQTSARTMGYA